MTEAQAAAAAEFFQMFVGDLDEIHICCQDDGTYVLMVPVPGGWVRVDNCEPVTLAAAA